MGLPAAPADPGQYAAHPQLLQLRRRGHGSVRVHRRGCLYPQSRSLRAPGDARRQRAGSIEGRGPQQRELELGQPASGLYARHRAGDAAGQRSGSQQHRPERKSAPGDPERAAGLVAGSAGRYPAAHLLRHPDNRGLRDRGRGNPGVRLSIGHDYGRRVQQLDGHDRHQAGHSPDQAAFRRSFWRPQLAHQQPGERQQPASDEALNPGARPGNRAVPSVRQGSVSGRDLERAPRLHARCLYDYGRPAGRQQLRPEQ